MKRGKALLGIVAFGVISFLIAVYTEASVVWALYDKPTPWFRDFMAHSIFEGESFGGSDIGVVIAIFCFFEWASRRRGYRAWTRFDTEDLRFVWQTSLITAIVAVHSLKWIISRARPKLIFTPDFLSQLGSHDVIARMTWSGFLPWDGPRGYSFNSFPSGHTASCAIMLTVVYSLFRAKSRWALIGFLMVASYSFLMAVARSMAGMHWLSDSVASFFICWAIIHRCSEMRAAKGVGNI